MCNARGVDEAEIWDTWTFRRLLHAYLILVADRTMAVQLVAGAFKPTSVPGRRSGRPGRAAAPSVAGHRPGLPGWFRDHRRRTNYAVVGVEDPVEIFKAAGIPVSPQPVDRAAGAAKAPPGGRGVGTGAARIRY